MNFNINTALHICILSSFFPASVFAWSCSKAPSKSFTHISPDAEMEVIANHTSKGMKKENSLPNIKYIVKKQYDSPDDEPDRLFAIIDEESYYIGSIDQIFGQNNLCNMNVFAEEDFNGDGIMDALVSDTNIGNGGGSSWTFITYAGNNSFEKSDIFSETAYYDHELAEVDGLKVLDFVKNDLGQKVVRERHALIDGNVVSLDLPKVILPAVSILKSIKMDDMENGDYFYYDLNGDGKPEKIVTTGSFHFFRSFIFNLNGKEYEFNADGLWGCGTLHILKSKTNGMRDIMTEQDTRTLYRWDGTTYTFE